MWQVLSRGGVHLPSQPAHGGGGAPPSDKRASAAMPWAVSLLRSHRRTFLFILNSYWILQKQWLEFGRHWFRYHQICTNRFAHVSKSDFRISPHLTHTLKRENCMHFGRIRMFHNGVLKYPLLIIITFLTAVTLRWHAGPYFCVYFSTLGQLIYQAVQLRKCVMQSR